MRRPVAILLIWLAWNTPSQGNALDLTARTLQPSSSSEIPIPPFGAWGESQCSGKGNIFFHADTGAYNDSVILELATDGASTTLYELPAEKARGSAFGAFNITPTGSVYLVVETRDAGTRVFKFNADGKLASEFRAETPEYFLPRSILAFESGAVLVGGYRGSEADSESRGKSFLGLFEPSGRLRVDFSAAAEDIDLKAAALKPHEGAMSLGPDGNAYLLTSRDIVVLSESGSIVRRMAYQKPEAQAIATQIIVSETLIAVWLISRGKDDIAVPGYLVLNYESGEPFGLYSPTDETGNRAVCFTRRDGFTFLRNVDGRLRIIKANLN